MKFLKDLDLMGKIQIDITFFSVILAILRGLKLIPDILFLGILLIIGIQCLIVLTIIIKENGFFTWGYKDKRMKQLSSLCYLDVNVLVLGNAIYYYTSIN